MNSLEIGRRISQARENANLTRKELANKVNLAASTIGRYEHGEIENVKIPVIKAIAMELHVNPMWLIGKSNYENLSEMKHSWEDKINLTIEEKELIKKYRQLSPAGKAAVDAVLESQYEFVKPKLSNETETS